jgi:hypothetical protein
MCLTFCWNIDADFLTSLRRRRTAALTPATVRMKFVIAIDVRSIHLSLSLSLSLYAMAMGRGQIHIKPKPIGLIQRPKFRALFICSNNVFFLEIFFCCTFYFSRVLGFSIFFIKGEIL